MLVGLLAILAHGFGHPHLDQSETATHHAAVAHPPKGEVVDGDCGTDTDHHQHRDERPRQVQPASVVGDIAPQPAIADSPATFAVGRPTDRRHPSATGVQRLRHLCVSRI
jgi:hypothetical protein